MRRGRENYFLMFLALALGITFAQVKISQSKITQKDISSAKISMDRQQKAVLLFEKKMQCDNFGHCMDSYADGAVERNPSAAVENCQNAVEGLSVLSPFAELPDKVKNMLNKSKNMLYKNAQWSLLSSKYFAKETTQTAGFPPSGSSTCEAYAIIEKVNLSYDIKKLMGKHYINCDVLNDMFEE
jgi:hypothetical protein